MRRTGPTQAVRDLAFGRDQSRCVICDSTEQLQLHHRRPRGMGGSRRDDTNSPANLVVLCLEHHQWVESNRDLARDRGFLLRQTDIPSTTPLVWKGEWTLLNDDGTYDGPVAA